MREPAQNRPLRVLVVEDDEATLRFMTIFLEKDGFEVLAAGDAHAALALVAGASPDVMVLDWSLPDSSGPELLQEMRNRDSSVIPAIALTGFAAQDLEDKGLALFAACVSKPIHNLHAFSSLIRSVALPQPPGTAPGG